jgi:hypothetical protein
MTTGMIRARLRIWAVLSFFPFTTPTCCMHHPRENIAEVQRAAQVSRAGDVANGENGHLVRDGMKPGTSRRPAIISR